MNRPSRGTEGPMQCTGSQGGSLYKYMRRNPRSKAGGCHPWNQKQRVGLTCRKPPAIQHHGPLIRKRGQDRCTGGHGNTHLCCNWNEDTRIYRLRVAAKRLKDPPLSSVPDKNLQEGVQLRDPLRSSPSEHLLCVSQAHQTEGLPEFVPTFRMQGGIKGGTRTSRLQGSTGTALSSWEAGQTPQDRGGEIFTPTSHPFPPKPL